MSGNWCRESDSLDTACRSNEKGPRIRTDLFHFQGLVRFQGLGQLHFAASNHASSAVRQRVIVRSESDPHAALVVAAAVMVVAIMALVVPGLVKIPVVGVM